MIGDIKLDIFDSALGSGKGSPGTILKIDASGMEVAVAGRLDPDQARARAGRPEGRCRRMGGERWYQGRRLVLTQGSKLSLRTQHDAAFSQERGASSDILPQIKNQT